MKQNKELWGMPVMDQKKKRNLAKVHYEKMDDGTFLIVALENFSLLEKLLSNMEKGQ